MRNVFLLLLLRALCAVAATPDFLHGLDYSQWLPANTLQIAADDSGAIYVLTASQALSNTMPPSTVTKLSADGKTILWQNQLPFPALGMAVDPKGGVFVRPYLASGESLAVKLGADGAGVAWTKSVGVTPQVAFLPPIATDANGRVYMVVSGGGDSYDKMIVRVSADGTMLDYQTHFHGNVTSIAADASGAAFLTGYVQGGNRFLARLAPNGTAGFYSTSVNAGGSPAIALDASGNAVVLSGDTLQRFDVAGNLTSSKKIGSSSDNFPTIALDGSGNAYVFGTTSGKAAYPVKNSVAPCGSLWMTVVAPDGSILQTTYIPQTTYISGLVPAAPPIVRRDSSVLYAGLSPTGYAPARTGPFAAETGSGVLVEMALNTNAQPLSLTCASSGAVYKPSPVTPGEIFILFGSTLGPAEGVEFRATVDRPYPTRLADVEVTFDGKLVPLIWVQDAQINLVTPWWLTPGRDTEVCVSYQGVKTNCLTLPVRAIDPGVFTTNGSNAIAFNEDGGQNTEFHAAAPNTQLTVFATGLGPIDPPPAEGTILRASGPVNVLPIEVYAVTFIPGPGHFGITEVPVQTEVTSAGPAPYHPAGITQITFRVTPRVNQYYVKLPSGQSQHFVIYNVN